MTTPKRGFAMHEIIFAMVGAFFMMGMSVGSFYNGGMLREMCYVVAGVLAIVGVLFALIISKVDDVKKEKDPNKITPAAWGLVCLGLVFFIVMLVAIIYVGDRQSNPTEEFCHNIGANKQEMSSLDRGVVRETGQCIENETGFHANGKAIFK